MKTIGLIGGMSWESTEEYYRIINETVRKKLGGLHSASCLLYSFDFAELEILQRQGAWQEAGERLADAAQQLEKAGADCILICANTMHKVADQVQECIHIPVIHIVDATSLQIKAAHIHTVGLLGTRYTMEEKFIIDRLVFKHGFEVLVPEAGERSLINQIIFEELCLGIINPLSKAKLLEIINHLVGFGAQGVILGCTELDLILQAKDISKPVFDTTSIHAKAAVDFALG